MLLHIKRIHNRITYVCVCVRAVSHGMWLRLKRNSVLFKNHFRIGNLIFISKFGSKYFIATEKALENSILSYISYCFRGFSDCKVKYIQQRVHRTGRIIRNLRSKFSSPANQAVAHFCRRCKNTNKLTLRPHCSRYWRTSFNPQYC